MHEGREEEKGIEKKFSFYLFTMETKGSSMVDVKSERTWRQYNGMPNQTLVRRIPREYN